MDEKKKIITARNILIKCFVIGVFFMIIAGLSYLPCKCVVASVYKVVFGISTPIYNYLWAGFVGLIKTILIFGFLVPALALHWTSLEK